MLVNNSMFNFSRENSFVIEFRVRGWVGGYLGGPFDYRVSQVQIPETLDLRLWIRKPLRLKT